MTTRFVNLTPHEIKVQVGGEVKAFPPSGTIARVSTSYEVVGEVDGIPVVQRTFGEIEGLPSPETGTIYIVSGLVASATTREDVVAPDTGPTAIRDENGHIVAVTRFVKAG